MVNNFIDLFIPHGCRIVIEPSLTSIAKALIEHAGINGKHLLAICDAATHEALGKRIVNELGIDALILDGTPHADIETVTFIRARRPEALVAIGSGTINDLCKYAAFQDNIPYVVFPTAPSMNGYFSANASITVDGHKHSFSANVPRGIFCDLEVLTAAPQRLILSGLGDSLCRPTAQADWLLSHLLFDTPYNPSLFSMIIPYERELFYNADRLASRDPYAIENLIRILLVSGLAMVKAGGSYPASQGEHLIAHTMEMKHGNTLPQSYHGEQIGVTTLIMAEIQRRLLSRKMHLEKPKAAEQSIAQYFDTELAKSVKQSYHEKSSFYDEYSAANKRLLNDHLKIHDKISSIGIPETILRGILQKAKAPTSPESIGWRRDDLEAAIKQAKFIRNRFTFLDFITS